MNRVLILFAHSGQRHSKVHVKLAEVAKSLAQDLTDVCFIDLYELYPRFDIDAEQQRLLAHDVIVLHFSIFWYSTPSLLKEWQDLVLE